MNHRRLVRLGGIGAAALALIILYVGSARRADEPVSAPPVAATMAQARAAEGDDTEATRTPGSDHEAEAPAPVPGNDSDELRDAVALFVRQLAAGQESPPCPQVPGPRPAWTFRVTMYHQGRAAGTGTAEHAEPCQALREAATRAMAADGLDREQREAARFVVEIPDAKYALVELDGRGHELIHGAVAVRTLDKALLLDRIRAGKEYLFRVLDPERGGAHKYYHATEDRFEERLHTIYTASLIYTLLKLEAWEPDPRIPAQVEKSAAFLLSMQNREPGDRGHGGFYYSLDLETGAPEPRIVVGTTSKTIFTLLVLHERTGDERYLEAAGLAADWLLTMQNPDGSVKPLIRKIDGAWAYIDKESLLYTGQVLSALSRIHAVTREPRHLDAADLTARRLMRKVEERGCFLGDDYRSPNPVSSSWVVLALFDFARATGSDQAMQVAFRCANELLRRQIDNPRDVYRHGRWRRSLSASGNGWLAEVLSELYLHCERQRMGGCERYRQAIVNVLRLLMQHTYTPASAYVTARPERAVGGVFWNVDERHVRTDAVCHAMNAYVHMVERFGDEPLVTLPEPPLAERLGVDRLGAREGRRPSSGQP